MRRGQAEAILVAYDVMNRPTNFRAALSAPVKKIVVLELDARLAYQRGHLLNAVQAVQSRPVMLRIGRG